MGNSFKKGGKGTTSTQIPGGASSKGAAAPAKGGRQEDDDSDEIGAAADGRQVNEFKAEDTAPTDSDEAYSFWDRNKTFKQREMKTGKQQKLQGTMKATMKATLGGGELRKTVQLPEGEDLNEWIAVNTVHFFNAASMIYGTCSEFCTKETCETMSAGRAEYLWKDGVKYKKPTRMSAPVYIETLLSWVDEQISNPNLFPVDENAKFPRNFLSVVKNIYKRLFRLYAHIY